MSLDVTGLALTLTDARDVTCFEYTYDMLGRQLHADGVDNGLRWALPDGAGRPWLSWRGDDVTGDPGFRNRATYDAMGRPVARWQKRDGTSSELCRSLTIYGERKSDAVVDNRLGAVWRQYDEGGATVVNEYDFKGVPRVTARRLIAFVAERDPDTAEFWDFDSDWSAIAAATSEAAIDTADGAAPLETTTWSSQSLVDALGRPYLTETPTAAGGVPVVQHLQYDGGGALAEVEVTDRASTQTQVHGLRYNARGQRTQVEHGNGVTTTFTYDPDTFRLTRQVAERSDTSKLQDLRLTWGPAGQIYAIRDGVQTLVYYDNEITHPERQFVYDARGRLIRATGREHATTYGLDPASVPSAPCSIPGPASEVSGYIRDYEWDAAGNMTELSVVGGWTRTLVYEDVSNRLKTFTWSSPSTTTNYITYDQFGQMEGLPSAKDLRWDGDGNLRCSSPLTTGATTRTWYVYVGAQRVRKVTEEKDGTDWHIAKETVYLDGGFEVYRTYDVSGTLQLEREHVRISDGAVHALEIETVLVEGGIAVSTITPLYRYSLVDQIGSVSVELDHNAAVVTYEEYHPFGTTAYYSDTRGAQAKRYRYSGKERDAETGLYYYGYRYYAPGVARWTAPDPAGTVDGSNLYAFVGGDSIGRVDADGREDEPSDPVYGMVPFEVDSSAITAGAWQQLRSFVDTVPADSEVTVIGAASRTGDPEYNFKLSAARQEAVLDALAKLGARFNIGLPRPAGEDVWRSLGYRDEVENDLHRVAVLTARFPEPLPAQSRPILPVEVLHPPAQLVEEASPRRGAWFWQAEGQLQTGTLHGGGVGGAFNREGFTLAPHGIVSGGAAGTSGWGAAEVTLSLGRSPDPQLSETGGISVESGVDFGLRAIRIPVPAGVIEVGPTRFVGYDSEGEPSYVGYGAEFGLEIDIGSLVDVERSSTLRSALRFLKLIDVDAEVSVEMSPSEPEVRSWFWTR